jgi:hypothetical protein
MSHPYVSGKDVLPIAAEKKISDPVVLTLVGGSTHSRSIANDPGLYEMTKGIPFEKKGAVGLLLEAKDAAKLLREHAGKGGAYIAEILEKKIMNYQYSIVDLMPERIGYASYFDDMEVIWNLTPYDRVERVRPLARNMAG